MGARSSVANTPGRGRSRSGFEDDAPRLDYDEPCMRILIVLLVFACSVFAQPRDLQLFLLVGQSNMAGRGPVEPQDREPIPQVFSLNKQMEWAPAIDPLHFDKPEIAAVG